MNPTDKIHLFDTYVYVNVNVRVASKLTRFYPSLTVFLKICTYLLQTSTKYKIVSRELFRFKLIAGYTLINQEVLDCITRIRYAHEAFMS